MVVGRANQFLAMRPRMGILLADAWSHRGHAAATRYKKGVALRAWALLHFRIVGVVFHFYEANALSSVAVPITIRPSSWPPKLGSETGVVRNWGQSALPATKKSKPARESAA
jgi:hypothetical protein